MQDLSMNGISFRYTTNYIFKDFSLAFDSPIIILKGENGIGKSTLLKLACRILLPEHGNVKTGSSSALVLQEDALFPWLTVKDNLSLVAPIGNFKDKVPSLFGICEQILEVRVSKLSYGQRRLVELCRILGSSARLIHHIMTKIGISLFQRYCIFHEQTR
jgi:ABC-2 type transport system ATP-binding protein